MRSLPRTVLAECDSRTRAHASELNSTARKHLGRQSPLILHTRLRFQPRGGC